MGVAYYLFLEVVIPLKEIGNEVDLPGKSLMAV